MTPMEGSTVAVDSAFPLFSCLAVARRQSESFLGHASQICNTAFWHVSVRAPNSISSQEANLAKSNSVYGLVL
jgi:hypothetical protein